jgi:chorismate dehydratase
VLSVLLAYTGELNELRSVQLDPSSHTSNYLAQIVLGDFHGLQLDYVHITERITVDLPAVMIGDPAISYSKRTSPADARFLDLGSEWVRHTGLPFVFALWALGNDYPKKLDLASTLRNSKDLGMNAIGRIASGTADPEFTKSYLGGAIRYDLGEEEKRGLDLFRESLKKITTLKTINNINYF